MHELRNKLPIQTTEEKTALRNKLWKLWDTNGNGFVSLTEITNELAKMVEHPDASEFKTIVEMAAVEAKKAAKSNSPRGIEQIEKAEFRYFLLYFLQYYEHLTAFKKLDLNGDHLIDKEEFEKGKQILLKWKIQPSKVTQLSKTLEVENTSSITFEKFSAWLSEMEDVDLSIVDMTSAN